MHHEESLYDQNDYYADDARASRLTPLLNPLLRFLDHRKARSLLARALASRAWSRLSNDQFLRG